MRSLVVSDLHLGSRMQRDVLLRPPALERLLDALDDVDRLVLLGDTVELLEGRPKIAMGIAEPVLRAIGDKVGRGREVVLVPGNHDHALVRPWLRGMRSRGRRIGLSERVPVKSGRQLEQVVSWLRPASVRVHYPGVTLAPRVWATHGHYLDRHLVPEGSVGLKKLLGTVPPKGARPEDYEAASGPSIAAMQGLLASSLPQLLGEPIDRVAGVARRGALAALPVAAALRGGGALAPLSAGILGYQFKRAGLPAMASVAERLRVRADHVLFGHVHRLGPRGGELDDPLWAAKGPALWNTGCWVYEPLLLAGAEPPHPYWPGGAVVVEPGVAPRAVGLLDDVDPAALR